MLDNIERRYPLLALDDTTITAMLSPLFPQRQLVSVEALSGGLINTNYKIRLTGLDEPFVLRIYMRDRAACEKEAALFSLIQKTVPVPEVLYADTEGREYEQPYVVMKWVDGVPLSKALSSGNNEEIQELAASVGAVLAAIGTYTFPSPGYFGPSLTIAEPLEDVETYIKTPLQGKAGERLGEVMTQRVLQLLTENNAYFQEVENEALLVHADFQPSNIRMRKEGEKWKVMAVFDWEFAVASTPLFDIGIHLRHDSQIPPSYEAPFIASYRQHGGILPPSWKKITKLLDLVNLCEFLNGPERGSLIPYVKGKVIETMECWETY
ncbi:MAG: aminoglycoside phosphotransferase family protein [Chloroflexota bacterium]|nr:aminoglycoside phosphotransferase family protein [Chloroflexota bacterium]